MKNILCFTLGVIMLMGPAGDLTSPEVQDYIEREAEVPVAFQKYGNTLILMYHALVESGEPTAEQNSLYTTAEKLAADIDALHAAGYQSLSLLRYRIGLFDPQQKYFILTFDDGYDSNYTVAYPVLQEKGVFADIFANTEMMDRAGHLTWDMCREMEQSGLVRIYSHLNIHTAATSLSPGEQRMWLEQSVRAISRELGERAVWGMSYPYGDYDRSVFELYRSMGASFQLVQGIQFEDPELLVRVNVPYDADMDEIIATAAHN